MIRLPRSVLLLAAVALLALAGFGMWTLDRKAKRVEQVLLASEQAGAKGGAEAQQACTAIIGALKEALDNLEGDDKKIPLATRGHRSLGQCLAHMNRLEDAVAAYRKAIALTAETSYLHGEIALLYSRMGQHMPAQRSARLAVQLDPQVWIAHRQLARVSAAARQLAQAEASYEEALKLAPPEQIRKLQDEINQFKEKHESARKEEVR